MAIHTDRFERRSGAIGKVIGGLLFGAVIGAGVALLSAPQSGTQTRAMIREKGMELREKVMASAEETKTRAGEKLAVVKDRATEVLRKVRKNSSEPLAELTSPQDITI